MDKASAPLKVSRSRALRGVCAVPGDPGCSLRALLFGSMCEGAMEVRGLSLGSDLLEMARALRSLGISINLQGPSARVEGGGLVFRPPSSPIDCGASWTTLRLLTGLLAGQSFESTLGGDPSLADRSIELLAQLLREMGAQIEGQRGDQRSNHLFAPLRVRGRTLRGISCTLPASSAVVKSALVLAALQAKGRTVVTEPEPSLDQTERMLRALGAPVTIDAARSRVTVDPAGGKRGLRGGRIDVPGDLTAASFLLVAALLVPGSDLTVENVGLNPTRAVLLAGLRDLGADLELTPTGEATGEPVGRVRARWRPLRSAAIGRDRVPHSFDEFVPLVVAAAMAQGQTRFTGLGRLRANEAARLTSLARELGRAGITAAETSEGLVVDGTGGRPPRGGLVCVEQDDSVAMAAAVLGLCADEPTLLPVRAISLRYPSLAGTLRGLGAEI